MVDACCWHQSAIASASSTCSELETASALETATALESETESVRATEHVHETLSETWTRKMIWNLASLFAFWQASDAANAFSNARTYYATCANEKNAICAN